MDYSNLQKVTSLFKKTIGFMVFGLLGEWGLQCHESSFDKVVESLSF